MNLNYSILMIPIEINSLHFKKRASFFGIKIQNRFALHSFKTVIQEIYSSTEEGLMTENVLLIITNKLI